MKKAEKLSAQRGFESSNGVERQRMQLTPRMQKPPAPSISPLKAANANGLTENFMGFYSTRRK
jgi:hypothetical protein